MKPLPCPACGGTVKPVRVVTAFPVAEGMRAADEGRIVLGGCDPAFGPDYICPE